MKVQRFDFKEFGEAIIANRPAKQFLPTGRPREEAPPPPPTFSEEELKAAERESYKKGFLEGTQEGRKQAESEQAAVEKQLSETAEKFTQFLSPLLADYRARALEIKEQMPKVALAIARKVAGHALGENAPAAVEEVALRCVEAMATEPKLTITVHESLGDALEKKLQAIADRLPAATDIVIQRDPQMEKADCRIEWSHGMMKRDTADLWAQIEKAVDNLSATAKRDGQEQMNTLGAINPANPTDETTTQPNPAPPPGDAQDVKPKE